MTTYAIAPEGSTYFTAGKQYEVMNDSGYGFYVVYDLGFVEYTLWKGGTHFSDPDSEWIKAEPATETPATVAQILREILEVLRRIEARGNEEIVL